MTNEAANDRLEAAESGESMTARPSNPYPLRSPFRWFRELRSGSAAQRWPAVVKIAVALCAYALVLICFGAVPGHLPNPIDIYSGVGGIAACGARDFPAHLFTCPNVGFPAGLQLPTAQPAVWLASTLQWLGLNVVNADRTVWILVLALGLFGARRFFLRVTPIWWLAWVGVLGFLLAPIVSGQGGYGALQLGFLLVPSYLLTDLRVLEALSGGRSGRVIAGRVLALVAVRTLGLMLEPYSFVVTSVGVLIIGLLWGVRAMLHRQFGRVAVAAGAVIASYVVAYLVYSRSVETDAFAAGGLDYFRAAAVDLYALVVPSNTLWWAELTGWHFNIGPLQAYSDGHNLNDVYLGGILLGLAIMGVCVGGRRDSRAFIRIAAGTAGLVVFLLALGPSIRIGDFRIIAPDAPITYVMPAADATATSPWSWVYLHVPGVSLMRAVWRWELGVRLAAMVLAVVALTWWVERTRSMRTRWIPMVLGAVLVIESLGTLPPSLDRQRDALNDVRTVETLVTTPLAALVHPGERTILYGAGGVSQGSNDYIANFICPLTNLRCYNAGGDKSLGNALRRMPPVAREILVNHAQLGDSRVQDRVQTLFAANQLDLIVLVNFDLAAQASAWPPAAGVREQGEAAARKMFTGPGFARIETPWFTVVRPAAE